MPLYIIITFLKTQQNLPGLQFSLRVAGNYAGLREIYAKETKIHGPIDIGLILKSAVNLAVLNVENNCITALGEKNISTKHSALTELVVKNNKIAKLCLLRFAQHCPELVTLDVRNNKDLCIDSEGITNCTQMVIDCSGCALTKEEIYSLKNNALVMPKNSMEKKFERIVYGANFVVSPLQGFGITVALQTLIAPDMSLAAGIVAAGTFSGMLSCGNYFAGKGLQQCMFPLRDIREHAAYAVICDEQVDEFLNLENVVIK